MPIEVEQKFRVADADDLRRKLDAHGFRPAGEVTQVDTYLAHPARDFAAADEALRIRASGHGDRGGSVAVTFKGPRSAGPVKTRFESEFPVLATEPTVREFFGKLGFGVVARVEKRRASFEQTDDSGDEPEGRVTLTLDDVTGLGLFTEVEVVVPDGEPPETAEALVRRWAAELELGVVEPRSYLEMLLAGGRTKSPKT